MGIFRKEIIIMAPAKAKTKTLKITQQDTVQTSFILQGFTGLFIILIALVMFYA